MLGSARSVAWDNNCIKIKYRLLDPNRWGNQLMTHCPASWIVSSVVRWPKPWAKTFWCLMQNSMVWWVWCLPRMVPQIGHISKASPEPSWKQRPKNFRLWLFDFTWFYQLWIPGSLKSVDQNKSILCQLECFASQLLATSICNQKRAPLIVASCWVWVIYTACLRTVGSGSSIAATTPEALCPR